MSVSGSRSGAAAAGVSSGLAVSDMVAVTLSLESRDSIGNWTEATVSSSSGGAMVEVVG